MEWTLVSSEDVHGPPGQLRGCGGSSCPKVSRSNSSQTTENMGRRHISSLALLLPVLASTTNAVADAPRPRGVGPDCSWCQHSSDELEGVDSED